ncbi:unnamed protein product [Diamesa tonsa]
MELTKMVQDNLVNIALAGIAIAIGTIIAANFDWILFTCKDFSAKFEKKPVPPASQTTVENLGNIDEVYKDEQTNHETTITDNIFVPSSTCLKNVANIKKVHEKKVEGGKTTISRNIDLTKKKET